MKMLFLTMIMTLTFGAFIAVEAQSKPQEVKIQIGKQKTVTKDKIKIKFLSLVEDSRCPEGANCVWAGNAKIKIEVFSCNKGKEIFEINTNTGARGTAFESYAINLISLTPTPKENVRINKNSYVATFEIRRLTR